MRQVPTQRRPVHRQPGNRWWQHLQLLREEQGKVFPSNCRGRQVDQAEREASRERPLHSMRRKGIQGCPRRVLPGEQQCRLEVWYKLFTVPNRRHQGVLLHEGEPEEAQG